MRILRITSSGPAAEEVVVGEETWNAGDGVKTGYETSNSPGLTANTFWFTLCCTLFLVGGK
jgi:hypothetical protein